MSAAEAPKISPAEYLDRKRAAEEKHKYVDGEVLAMAGSGHKPNLIAVNAADSSGSPDGPAVT